MLRGAGLLGLAFHPRYSENGFFFVDYTNTAGDTVIARYRVSSNPGAADPSSGVTLLTIAQPFANHNGGQLAFGPDGYLYVGELHASLGRDPGARGGDRGRGGDQFRRPERDPAGGICFSAHRKSDGGQVSTCHFAGKTLIPRHITQAPCFRGLRGSLFGDLLSGY